MKQKALFAFVTLLAGSFLGCSNASRPLRATSPGARNECNSSTVSLIFTPENQGRRCEARNYIFSSIKDDKVGRECYKLEKQLSEATAKNDLTAVTEALKYGAHPDGITDDNYTALHSAALNGYVEIACLLLHNGANPNWGDFIAGTPLIVAANAGRTGVVKVLLANGANACLRADGGTALDGARRHGHQEIVDLLIAAGGDKCK